MFNILSMINKICSIYVRLLIIYVRYYIWHFPGENRKFIFTYMSTYMYALSVRYRCTSRRTLLNTLCRNALRLVGNDEDPTLDRDRLWARAAGVFHRRSSLPTPHAPLVVGPGGQGVPPAAEVTHPPSHALWDTCPPEPGQNDSPGGRSKRFR